MSNIIHKMSEKLTGHGHHDEERDDQGNNLSYEQRSMRDTQGKSGMPMPSQHLGDTETTSGHKMQSKHGGYEQQERDLGGNTGGFTSNRSHPAQQMPGPMISGQGVSDDAWDEGDADVEGRGTRRKEGSRMENYADEYQQRYL
ncbi:LADA_0F12376g1_1 [Lachancea dasiensis]|uniref:LADA_0F12376g1_1 n=1 Tax=Lachancea dasiensis TaxID=1072105 RepID=A0A1G4JMU5_9SACH|nr:LADA_0F12376g1_1 [Lachancea dasiensis]